MSRSRKPVTFRETADARYPFEAEVDGATWTVRINEFPEAPSLYSLVIDGEVVEELMEWPAAWTRRTAAGSAPRPGPTRDADDDPYEKAEYDREQEHVRRAQEISPSRRVSR